MNYEVLYNKIKDEMARIVVCLNKEEGYEGNLAHTYFGAWNNENRLFVKSFVDNKVEFTHEEIEAKNFFSDKECDECMAELIIHYNVWTIAIWGKLGQCVHYPNEHWKNNGYLQPSFIKRESVQDFDKENIVFDKEKGWIKKNVVDFESVYSKEEIEEIDKRILRKQKKYDAELRDKMMKAKDFPMTN